MTIEIFLIAAFIVVAVVSGLKITAKPSKTKAHATPLEERKVILLYLNAEGAYQGHKVEITRVFANSETDDCAQLHFEAIDSEGKKRTFDAEHVIHATATNGTELRHFSNYLRGILANEATAQTPIRK